MHIRVNIGSGTSVSLVQHQDITCQLDPQEKAADSLAPCKFHLVAISI